MKNNFYYSFPAIRGRQANRDFFVIMCPLSILPKLFIFNEEELPPEYRAQRILNKSRIPEMSSYMVNNPNDYVFSSLTASIDGEFDFSPMDEQTNDGIGILKICMDSKLLINDGQHRRAAIEDALKTSPELGNETISVVLFIDEGLKRSQQIFADLNKHAINVSKSIGILYDSRDPIAIITKNIVDENEYLKYYTDKENPSLPKYSPRLFTLSNINETNKKLLNKLDTNDEKVQDFAKEFWNFLCDNMHEWKLVFNKQISSKNFRSEYISANGVVLEAIGMLGNYIYNNSFDSWKTILSGLKDINWSRSNLEDWENRVISPAGKIVKSANHVRLTKNLLKIKLNLPLSTEEKKLEKSIKKEG